MYDAHSFFLGPRGERLSGYSIHGDGDIALLMPPFYIFMSIDDLIKRKAPVDCIAIMS